MLPGSAVWYPVMGRFYDDYALLSVRSGTAIQAVVWDTGSNRVGHRLFKLEDIGDLQKVSFLYLLGVYQSQRTKLFQSM